MGVPLNGWPFSGTFSTVSLHRYSEHFLINDLKSETSGRSFSSDVLSDLTCSFITHEQKSVCFTKTQYIGGRKKTEGRTVRKRCQNMT